MKKKFKIFFKNLKKKLIGFKNYFIYNLVNNPIDVTIIIISILFLIISSFTLGILLSLLIFIIINLIYLTPIIINKIKEKKERIEVEDMKIKPLKKGTKNKMCKLYRKNAHLTQ